MGTEIELNAEVEASAQGKPIQDFEGMVAFVTGASRGIGAATAQLLAARGAAVGVNYHQSEATAKSVVASIEAAGGTALAVQADITREDEARAAIDAVEEGLGPISVAVFNAHGLSTPARAPFLKVPQWLIEDVILRQVRALLIPSRILLPRMAERGQGSVVVVTSTQVLHPAEQMLALAMGKGALAVAVKSLAQEYSPRKIRINAIAPGPICTDATAMILSAEYKQSRADGTPLGRLGLPEDVAGPIVALAAPSCGFVTGASLQVNGGLLMA
ncbi:MAG: SDR family oxidoreductase [Actinomycetota bacterium]|nr:SDR family oxidoreductase [Actinomycetota bacterium]